CVSRGTLVVVGADCGADRGRPGRRAGVRHVHRAASSGGIAVGPRGSLIESATGMPRCILSLDQGTTSSRAIVFDRHGEQLAVAQSEFPQIYPAPAHVEHDPIAIWSTQLSVAREAIERAGVAARDLAAIGITNQRETTVLWERATGRP